MVRYDIFIYCNWVYTRWQWSVDLYKNKREAAQKDKQYKEQYKITKYTKQKTELQNKKRKKNIIKDK